MTRTLSAALGILALFGAAAPGETWVVDDFDAPALAPEWNAWGATTKRVPAGEGGALSIAAFAPDKDQGSTLQRTFAARDLRGFESLAFTATRAGGPLDTWIQFRAGEGLRMVRRRVRLEDGTQEIVLPLRTFSDEWYGLLGSLEAPDRIQFHWDAPKGSLVLDALRLLPGKRAEGASRMSTEDWLGLAFAEGKGKAIPGKSFVLLTDRKEFQGPKGGKTLATLEEVVPILADRFALKLAPGERAPYFLVADSQALGDLYLVLGKEFSSHDGSLPSGSGSFARLGVAAACTGSDGQVYRPIVQHQALHLIVARSLRFGTAGDGIQEAIVSSVGRRMAPEYFDLPGIPWRRVSAESFRMALAGTTSNLLPLAKLLSPEGDRPENYIEFASLGDFLASRHRAKLPAAWDALRAMDKPSYEAGLGVLCGALGTTPAEFEAEWMKWGAANFK